MIKSFLPSWTACASAVFCLLTMAGCSAIAHAPPTTGVCYAGNNKIDRTIK